MKKRKPIKSPSWTLTADDMPSILRSVAISAFAVITALGLVWAVRVTFPEANLDALQTAVLVGVLGVVGGIFNRLAKES